MKRILLAALVMALFVPSVAKADVLLDVLLNTSTNEITIAATAGVSDVTISGSDTTGFYLDGFFGASTTTLGSSGGGDLTSAENTSDGSPLLFRAGGSTDTGLNIFSYTDDPSSDFVLGNAAFSGSGTWTVNAGAISDALAGSSTGNIYFPADSFDDIAGGASILGTYNVSVVPEPTSGILLVGGVLAVFTRRRR